MNFTQREFNRINKALASGEAIPKYDQLYAAQQALAWVLEPNGVKSPYDLIMDTPEGSTNCLDEDRPPQSSGTCAHCGLQ